jgi:hypothetical protein
VRRHWARILELGGLAAALLFVAGVVVGGGVVFALHSKFWHESKEVRRLAAFSEVAEPKAGDLAARFRPHLFFDSREHWRPLNVARMLDEGDHELCDPGCRRIASASAFERAAGNTTSPGSATHIDLAGRELGDYRGPRRCDERWVFDCGTGAGSAIYYHVTRSNDRFYVDYWWFMRFNNFERAAFACRNRALREQEACDEHEGDWEGVTAVTPPDDEAHLDYVVYAAHKGTFRYTAAKLAPPGHAPPTRPPVYVARGSHASYPTPCSKDAKGPLHGCQQAITIKGLQTLPEGRSDGKSPWARNEEVCRPNAPGSCLQSLLRPRSPDPQPWAVWAGHWGAGCETACAGVEGKRPDSPQSPGLQARYHTPWCSQQEGLFTCDSVALGCSDWLGPLVAAVACDPNRLAAALGNSNDVPAGSLSIAVRGEARNTETTPGVVQTLGDPLKPGERLTVTGAAPDAQVLVRAQSRRYVVEARFEHLRLDRRHRVEIMVGGGQRPHVHLEPKGEPVEVRTRRIEPQPRATS